MKYCSHCGKQLPDEATQCTECGAHVEGTYQPNGQYNEQYYQNGYEPEKSYSAISIVGVIFSVISPLIGLIISIIASNMAKKDNDKKSADLARIGIIISSIFIVLVVLAWLLILVMVGASARYYLPTGISLVSLLFL